MFELSRKDVPDLSPTSYKITVATPGPLSSNFVRASNAAELCVKEISAAGNYW